jgi:hypothetical protein
MTGQRKSLTSGYYIQDYAPVTNSPLPLYKKPDRPALTLSRRRFGRDAVLAGAVSLSAVNLLAGAPHTEIGGPASSGSLSLEPNQAQEVEAKLSNIIRKYGDRLSFAQREHLRRILAYNEKMLASIRAFPVQNGDAPASVLRISFSGETARPESHGAGKSRQSLAPEKTQQEKS